MAAVAVDRPSFPPDAQGDYIIEARRKLAFLMQDPSLAAPPPRRSTRRAFAEPRPKVINEETASSNGDRTPGQSTLASPATTRPGSRLTVRSERLSVYSNNGSVTSNQAPSFCSVPAIPRRSSRRYRPHLTQDKENPVVRERGLRHSSKDQELKERLERLSLDSAVCMHPGLPHSRASVTSSASSTQRSRRSRGRSSGSSSSNDNSSTSTSTPPSTPGEEKPEPLLKPVETPEATDQSSPVSSEAATRLSTSYTPSANGSSSRASSRGPRGLHKKKSSSSIVITPKVQRISQPTHDETSIFTSAWRNSDMYETPRNSIPIPIRKPGTRDSSRTRVASIPAVPKLPSKVSDEKVAGPEYQHDTKKVVVVDAISYFDDDSDEEGGTRGIGEKSPTKLRKVKDDTIQKREVSSTSSEGSEKPVSVAGGYAHVKNGNIYHTPAYMRVTPDAHEKARKALDKKQGVVSRETKQPSLFRKLFGFMLCSSSQKQKTE